MINSAKKLSSKVTRVLVDDLEFYVEPGFFFVNKSKHHFKMLADGGLVLYDLDNDAEPTGVEFVDKDHRVAKMYRDALFELEVLSEQDKEEAGS